MIYLAYSVAAAVIIFAAFIFDADRCVKKEIREGEKRKARIQYADQIINNILNQSDELAY